MTPHDLLANFEALAEAPNGIQRLRELVLELAVRGKLVEQDSGDEPAGELLKRIKGEKARLVKDGRIRAGKTLSGMSTENSPFEVPAGWVLCRLVELGFFLGGKTPSTNVATYWDGSIPWVSPKDMKSPLIQDTEDHVSEAAIQDGLPLIPKGSVLVVVRSGILRRMVPVAITNLDCTINQDLKALWPFPSANPRYIALMIKGFETYILEHLTKTGTTVESMKFEEFSFHPFLLPPDCEQDRILARVDDLMILLDRLEARRQKREAARTAARDSALAALREARTSDDVETVWLRIQERFHELFATPEDIDPLRQAVLFLAGEGRLVPQDPREGSAFDLINQIERAHRLRTKNGARDLKKHTSSPEPAVEPSVLPQGWAWASIEQCCEVVGGIQKTAARRPRNNPYPYLRVANVQRGRFDLSEVAQFELEPDELERWHLEPADLLIVEGNGSEDEIGRCAMWNGQIPNCVHQNHLIRCRAAIPSLAPYILHHLNSPQGISTMKTLAVTTSGLFNLSVGKIRSIRFPMPPEGEQRRILQRVGELMGIVDQLKTTLTNECQLSSAFAAAAVHHLDA